MNRGAIPLAPHPIHVILAQPKPNSLGPPTLTHILNPQPTPESPQYQPTNTTSSLLPHHTFLPQPKPHTYLFFNLMLSSPYLILHPWSNRPSTTTLLPLPLFAQINESPSFLQQAKPTNLERSYSEQQNQT